MALTDQINNETLERYYFGCMGVVSVIVVFCGFAPTYYLGAWFDAPLLNSQVQLHGIVFSLWIMLFAVQIGLVETNRITVHHKLGRLGGGLAVIMVILGVQVAIASGKRGHSPSPEVPALSFMVIPMLAIIAFGILVAFAVFLRHNSFAHKRLMLTATIAILAPAIARLPFYFITSGGPPVFFALTDVSLFVGVAVDVLAYRTLHWAWLLGGGVLIASQLGSLIISSTETWLTFAQWLVSAV
jgi:hypothetical protein